MRDADGGPIWCGLALASFHFKKLINKTPRPTIEFNVGLREDGVPFLRINQQLFGAPQWAGQDRIALANAWALSEMRRNEISDQNFQPITD
jgi:hypothetical protein